MLADLGLTPETAGKMLHVHPRTVRYWISGKTLIPYSAYRLLRILTGSELALQRLGWLAHAQRQCCGVLRVTASCPTIRAGGVCWCVKHAVLRPCTTGKPCSGSLPSGPAMWLRRRTRTAQCSSSADALGGAAIHGANSLKTAVTPPSSNTGGKVSRNITMWNMGQVPYSPEFDTKIAKSCFFADRRQ
jgi:hypothetical protein